MSAIQFRFKPIEKWPKEPTRERRRSNFKSTYGQTMKLLVRELEHLNVGEAFIYLWLGFGQIKKDGTPYADARPTQPGVILAFTGRHGSQTFPCDKYADWQDNLRCIALTLESLRAVDRYGATYSGEQYKGWSALPPADHSVNKAVGVLLRHAKSDAPGLGKEDFESVWKAAVQNTHPDRGGNADDFRAVMAARDLIRAEKGWA